jgi:hypothetical protein
LQQGQSARNARDGFPRQRVRTQLSIDERRFLLAVQKGDIKATKRYIAEYTENALTKNRSK